MFQQTNNSFISYNIQITNNTFRMSNFNQINRNKAALQQLKKHQTFLQKFKTFPEKSRKVIYLSCLFLPINHQHFLEITKPYQALIQHTDNKQTAFICSSLVKLYPTLNTQWLPGVIYPFVKLFEEDSIACFESSLAFLMNWYVPIFENYPNSPKKVIEFAKNYLNPLQKKLNALDYGLSALLNPMMLVCLTDTLNKKDFMQLLDYIIVRPYEPQLFLCALVSILEIVQTDLLKLGNVQDISISLRKQKKVSVEAIINRAEQIASENSKQLRIIYERCIFPVPKGRYPNFSFIIEEKIKPSSKQQYQQGAKIHQLKNKYVEIQKMIHAHKNCQAQNQALINSQYDEHQGQIRQYLNKIKQENQNKQRVYRQVQQKFKTEINLSGGTGNSIDKNLSRITKRGNLENEILRAKQQSRKIRQIQEDFLERMRKVAQIRRDELIDQERQLKREARLCERGQFTA